MGSEPLVEHASASHSSSPVWAGSKGEGLSVQEHLQPKVPSPSAIRQGSKESQDPAASAQKPDRASLHFLFKKSSLPESHALWKPVGVSSFLTNGHVYLCPFFWAWAEVSGHPGWGIQPPKLAQVLCSLYDLVVSRFWAVKPQLWFQSRELSAPPSADYTVFILASCLCNFPAPGSP